ncbi:MAG: DegT/DnrJ/EryC1/StrS family aminotransferase [Candidatus Omnitrophota bacterium]
MAKVRNIGLVNLSEEYALMRQEIKSNIDGCFKSHNWILGKPVYDFEKKAASYLGVKYAIGVNSGTDALILSLRSLAISRLKKPYFNKTDEIITTAFTFIATAEAIAHSGAKPVFVDIDPDTFTIDTCQFKQAITSSTVGVMPVHLYGLCCDIKKITSIARKHKIFVLEDAAQSFGAQLDGRKSGTFGDCGAFSFFPSKNLAAYGDAGLIATDSKEISTLAQALRNHGQEELYNASHIGYNSRLDSFQAAVLLVKMRYIERFNLKRRQIALSYNERLRNVSAVKLPQEPKSCRHVYNLYTIKVPARLRDQLVKHLNNLGISARIYYPLSLDKMKAFTSAKVIGSLPNTFRCVKTVLSLPSHPFLRTADINYISKAIRDFFKKKITIVKR